MVNSNAEHPPTRLNTLIVWAVVLGIAATLATGWGLIWRYNPSYSVQISGDIPIFLAAAMGAFILSRRPGHGVGVAMLASGSLLIQRPVQIVGKFIDIAQPQADLLAARILFGLGNTVWLGLLALPLIIALYPTGRFPSPRWRWIGIALAASTLTVIALVLAVLFLEQPINYDFSASDPPFMKIPAYAAAFSISGLLAVVGSVGALAALIVRAKHSRGVERQQIKWFALFGGAFIAILFPFAVAWALATIGTNWLDKFLTDYSSLMDVLSDLALLGMIAAIGIAIVRHRLFDIDVIIRKTLQWTVVTLLLGAVYVGTVLGLQELFKRVTGQTSEVAVALSTLVLAVAFMPIRRAVQNLIDKRFYRRRYNAEQVIEAYAASIKDEVDTAVIHQKMLGVLGDTLQPKKIVLFLAKPNPNAHPHPRFAPLPRRERE